MAQCILAGQSIERLAARAHDGKESKHGDQGPGIRGLIYFGGCEGMRPR